MGLFDKKFCDICGDKVNLLTQKKLSDGQLYSECKQKLGSFTSGWKQRTVQDVKAHLEQREQNKQKYRQFNCTAAAGGRNSTLQADFNHRWFIFAVDNRDFRSGNPQVFEFSQLQDFWIEPEYRTLDDSDNDGIPDNRDDFDNRQLMLLLSIGFFGCGAKEKYTAADVSVISFSCSSMSYTDSYVYSLKKENEEWLFDANYSYDYENPRVEFENKKVSAQDAAAILDVVKEQGLILQAQKYKPPRIKAFVLDDGGYFLYFKMNDGTEINAEIYNEDLVNELRTLTEKCRKS